MSGVNGKRSEIRRRDGVGMWSKIECVFVYRCPTDTNDEKCFGVCFQDLRLKFQRICTIWLRRQFQLGSIWRETERTRTPSLGWFSWRAESTVLLATTRRPRSSHLSGSSKCIETLHLYVASMTILILFYRCFYAVSNGMEVKRNG